MLTHAQAARIVIDRCLYPREPKPKAKPTRRGKRLADAAEGEQQLRARLLARPDAWMGLRGQPRCDHCGQFMDLHVGYSGHYGGECRYGYLCNACAATWVALGGKAVVRFATWPANADADADSGTGGVRDTGHRRTA